MVDDVPLFADVVKHSATHPEHRNASYNDARSKINGLSQWLAYYRSSEFVHSIVDAILLCHVFRIRPDAPSVHKYRLFLLQYLDNVSARTNGWTVFQAKVEIAPAGSKGFRLLRSRGAAGIAFPSISFQDSGVTNVAGRVVLLEPSQLVSPHAITPRAKEDLWVQLMLHECRHLYQQGIMRDVLSDAKMQDLGETLNPSEIDARLFGNMVPRLVSYFFSNDRKLFERLFDLVASACLEGYRPEDPSELFPQTSRMCAAQAYRRLFSRMKQVLANLPDELSRTIVRGFYQRCHFAFLNSEIFFSLLRQVEWPAEWLFHQKSRVDALAVHGPMDNIGESKRLELSGYLVKRLAADEPTNSRFHRDRREFFKAATIAARSFALSGMTRRFAYATGYLSDAYRSEVFVQPGLQGPTAANLQSLDLLLALGHLVHVGIRLGLLSEVRSLVLTKSDAATVLQNRSWNGVFSNVDRSARYIVDRHNASLESGDRCELRNDYLEVAQTRKSEIQCRDCHPVVDVVTYCSLAKLAAEVNPDRFHELSRGFGFKRWVSDWWAKTGLFLDACLRQALEEGKSREIGRVIAQAVGDAKIHQPDRDRAASLLFAEVVRTSDYFAVRED